MLDPRSDWLSRQRGYLTLIALLVVIAIIGILFAIYGGGGSGGTGGTVLGGAVDRARDVTCRNNLQQLRAAIGIYSGMNDGGFPPSLESLQAGVPPACPDGGEAYQYDATTGQVHCVHPGHQSF